MTKITKAVFPVAGMGTRFLPATKANPKEMLPVVDKPLIQYAVEEAVAAGITSMIFITGRNKRSIADHFDKAYELETELHARGRAKLLEILHNILPSNVSCIYLRQSQALGLGHAVLCARPVVGTDPFAVILADDLISAEVPAMKQMVDIHRHYNNSVIGVQQVAANETSRYGIVKVRSWEQGIHKIDGIVEKPQPQDAPSNLGVVGRYILTSRIFDHLEKVQAGVGGEIQLTDGIASLLTKEQVLAYEFAGIRYDCGDKLGYLQATVEYALRHPELAEKFRSYLQQLEY